ncbi:hypothetical protein [Roseimicrobium gellanilyticum]|nr:hypothetical protein [Roseimicrobium gellanilyticum]
MMRHRNALLSCGLPLVLLENERHWTYFLEHGYYTPPGFAEPVVNIDRMEKGHLESLLNVLEGTKHHLESAIVSRLSHLQNS